MCLEAEIQNEGKYVTSEDVTTFLLISFEETIMPSLLVTILFYHISSNSYILQLKAEIFDHCGPFAAFFNIARIQLKGLTETPNNNLAIKLGTATIEPSILCFVSDLTQLTLDSFTSHLM